jgi:hypothetical protein
MTVDPMDLARQWLRLVLIGGDLDDITAVVNLDHLKSDAPRPPALPYAGVMIDTDDTEGWATPHGWTEDTAGWPAVLPPGEKYPYHLDQVLVGQLAVALYGDDSKARGDLLRITLARPDVQELFADNNFTIKVAGGVTVTNAAEILDTSREARATAQFTISWAERNTSEVDAIETVTPTLTTPEYTDP